jgi:hypothetical protein
MEPFWSQGCTKFEWLLSHLIACKSIDSDVADAQKNVGRRTKICSSRGPSDVLKPCARRFRMRFSIAARQRSAFFGFDSRSRSVRTTASITVL